MPSTTRYKRGDIVLVSFPFTDLGSSKKRPALVVSPDSFNDRMQDLVLAAITSQGAVEGALTIDQGDCIEGVLVLLHLAVVAAKLCGPGGVRAVIAENLLLKQQLIVLRGTRQRAPNLTLGARLLWGFGSLFLSPGRIRKVALALRPSTLLAFHQALVRRKYRRLFSSTLYPKKPGPKGPDEALIRAIVELKSRNPRFGCPRIARIISLTFGVDIDKNVVYRVLARHSQWRPDDEFETDRSERADSRGKGMIDIVPAVRQARRPALWGLAPRHPGRDGAAQDRAGRRT